MAWNTWCEPNYIFFEENRLISSIVVFFSPFFLPLLFLLAGISTKYALQKRTNKEYLAERAKRLLVPLLFGTIVLMPIMTYMGDKFNYSYRDGFFKHYAVFFTKFTDLTGADGGFSVGQFWFLLYLFVISVLAVGIITLLQKVVSGLEKTIPFWLVFVLALPLPLISGWLSIGGKSLVEYTYFFLLGYYVFTDETIMCKLKDSVWILLSLGAAAAILNVYLFLWAEQEYPVILSYFATFVCCEISIRIPVLCFLTGTKYNSGKMKKKC